MPQQHRIDLGDVQETLLIPLYGRAQETQRGRGWLADPRAVEIVEAIDYDFSKLESPSLLGSVLRGTIYDHWVASFLDEHPTGTVVEIGAGLNTRYERLDNGKARWLEIDLPDAMELRRRFFDDTPRRTMHAGSIVDEDWIALAHALPSPWCFVSEAVIMYLPEGEVRTSLGHIATFGGSTLLIDLWGRWIIDHADEHDVLRALPVQVTWSCDDPAALEDWGFGLHLAESRTLDDPPEGVRTRLPSEVEDLMPVLGPLPQTQAYRLNRFTTEASA